MPNAHLAGVLDGFPQATLAHTPTPLDPLPRLGDLLGPRILAGRGASFGSLR
jgi:1-aminocyclopropane-1-carboxylate deaminase/D-cysteine desulfhydrase-like pyridoxal-dependent ACC family enzyme